MPQVKAENMPTMCSLTSKQLEELQVRYELNCNPSRKQVDDISTKMGLKSANVWVWFHRQRIREKSKIESQRNRRASTRVHVDVSRSTGTSLPASSVGGNVDRRRKGDQHEKLGNISSEKTANVAFSLQKKDCGDKSKTATHVGKAPSNCKDRVLRSCLKKACNSQSSPAFSAVDRSVRSNQKVKFAMSDGSVKEGTRTLERASVLGMRPRTIPLSQSAKKVITAESTHSNGKESFKDCNGNLVQGSKSRKPCDEAQSLKGISGGGRRESGKITKCDSDKTPARNTSNSKSQTQNLCNSKNRLPTENTETHHTKSQGIADKKSPGSQSSSSMHSHRAAEKNLRNLACRKENDDGNSEKVVSRNAVSRVLRNQRMNEVDYNCPKSPSTGKAKDTDMDLSAKSTEKDCSGVSVGTDIPVVLNQRQRTKAEFPFTRSVNVENLKKIKLNVQTGMLMRSKKEAQKERMHTQKTKCEGVHKPAKQQIVCKMMETDGQGVHAVKTRVGGVTDLSKDKLCAKLLQTNGTSTKGPSGHAASKRMKKMPETPKISGSKLSVTSSDDQGREVQVPNMRTDSEVKLSSVVEESKEPQCGYSPGVEEKILEQPKMKTGENAHTFKPFLSTERLKYCDDKFLFKKELLVNLIRVEVSTLESRKITVASKGTDEICKETKAAAAMVKSKECSAPHRSVWDSFVSLPLEIKRLETSSKPDESEGPKDEHIHEEVSSSVDVDKTSKSSDLTEECSSTEDSLTEHASCDSQDTGAVDGCECSNSEAPQEVDFLVVDEVWDDSETQLAEENSLSTINERNEMCVSKDMDIDKSSCSYEDSMDTQSNDVNGDTSDLKMSSDTMPAPDTTTMPESVHSDEFESVSPKQDDENSCRTFLLFEEDVRNHTLQSISVHTEKSVADSSMGDSMVGEMHVSQSSVEKSSNLVTLDNCEGADMHELATECNASEGLGTSCKSSHDDVETKGDGIIVKAISNKEMDESTPFSTRGTEGVKSHCENGTLLLRDEVTASNKENVCTGREIKVTREPSPCTRRSLQDCREVAANESDTGVASAEHSVKHSREIHVSQSSNEKSSGHVTLDSCESADIHELATECNTSEELGATYKSGHDDLQTRGDGILVKAVSNKEMDEGTPVESTPISTQGTEGVKKHCENDIMLSRDENMQPISSVHGKELNTKVHQSADTLGNRKSAPVLPCMKSGEKSCLPPHEAVLTYGSKISRNEATAPNKENVSTGREIKVPREPSPCTTSPRQDCREIAPTKSDTGVISAEHSVKHFTAEEQREETKQPVDDGEERRDVSAKLSLHSCSNSLNMGQDGSEVSSCTAAEASDDFDDIPPLVIDFDDSSCVTESMPSREGDNAVLEEHISQEMDLVDSDKLEACMPPKNVIPLEESNDLVDEVCLDQMSACSQSNVEGDQDSGNNVHLLIPQAITTEISRDQQPGIGFHSKNSTTNATVDPQDISHVMPSPSEDTTVGTRASSIISASSASSNSPKVCSANHFTSGNNNDCSSGVSSGKICEEDSSSASTKCLLKNRTCLVSDASECNAGISSEDKVNPGDAKDMSKDTSQTTVSIAKSDTNHFAVSSKLCQLEPEAKLKRKRCLDELVSQLKLTKTNPDDELHREKPSKRDYLPHCSVSINRKMQYVSMSADGHKRQLAPAEPPGAPKGRLIINKNRKRPPIPEEILCNIHAHIPFAFDKDWREVQSLVRNATCMPLKETGSETVEEPSRTTPLQASEASAIRLKELLTPLPNETGVPPSVIKLPVHKNSNLSTSQGLKSKEQSPLKRSTVKRGLKGRKRRASDKVSCAVAAKKSLFARDVGSHPPSDVHCSSSHSLNIAQPPVSPNARGKDVSFQAASLESFGFSPSAIQKSPESAMNVEHRRAPPSYQRHMSTRRASVDLPKAAVEDFQLPSIVRVYSLQDEGTPNLEDHLLKDKTTKNLSSPNDGALREEILPHISPTLPLATNSTSSAEISQNHVAGRIWYPCSPGQAHPRGPEVFKHQSMPQVTVHHVPVLENRSTVQSSNQLSGITESPNGNTLNNMYTVPLAINSPPPTPPQQMLVPVPAHLLGLQFLPAPSVENNKQNPQQYRRGSNAGNVDTSSHPPVMVNPAPLLSKLLETDRLTRAGSYPHPQWQSILPASNTSTGADSLQVVSSTNTPFRAQNYNQASINEGTTNRSSCDSPPVCTIYPPGSSVQATDPQLKAHPKTPSGNFPQKGNEMYLPACSAGQATSFSIQGSRISIGRN